MKDSRQRIRKRIGLALGGGAFRGLAHIGVLQVFKEHSIPIDAIAGTSMGSVIGALYATGMDPHFMRRMCEQFQDRDFLEFKMSRQGLLLGNRIQAILRTLTGNKSFDQTVLPFVALACDISTSELVVLREGAIHEAVRASISIPGIFAPHAWQGRLLVDGGVSERISCAPLRGLGMDYVIAVDVGFRGGAREVKPRAIDVIMHALEVMEWEVLREREHLADYWITPSLAHINPASIAQMEECIDIGRKAALEAVPKIKTALGIPEEDTAANPA